MTALLFWLFTAAVFLNYVTVGWSIARPDRRVWPAPGRDSWQFVYNGVVSYGGLLGVVVLGIVDRNSLGVDHWARFVVGGLLMTCGLFALWGYVTLGAQGSQGLGEDLVASGPYRYSRNPQYVGTVPAVIGYAILCNSTLALLEAILVSGWFLLVPFAEESWCRERLASYEDYVQQVPRFLGRRRPPRRAA